METGRKDRSELRTDVLLSGLCFGESLRSEGSRWIGPRSPGRSSVEVGRVLGMGRTGVTAAVRRGAKGAGPGSSFGACGSKLHDQLTTSLTFSTATTATYKVKHPGPEDLVFLLPPERGVIRLAL